VKLSFFFGNLKASKLKYYNENIKEGLKLLRSSDMLILREMKSPTSFWL